MHIRANPQGGRGDRRIPGRRRGGRHRLCRRPRRSPPSARTSPSPPARSARCMPPRSSGSCRLAARTGMPVVGFNDSGGARIQEGGGRAVRLRRSVLPERPAVGRGAADLGGLRALRGRRRLLAGADGLHHHDPQQRPHVHHRPRGHQGGHRQDGDDGRGRRRGDARLGQRQRPFPRRRRCPCRPAGAAAAELPAGQQCRGPAAPPEPPTSTRPRTRRSTI